MRNAVKVGKRVYLRLVEPGDARAFADASHLETETAYRPSGGVPTSAIAFESWIRPLGSRNVPEEIIFAICTRADDHFLGTVRLGHLDWINCTAEADRGQGIGTEAKHLLLEYAFVDLGLHALNSKVYEHNTRSAAALRKQGYRLAGRLTADVQRGGGFEDTLVFDITRDDWDRAHARWREPRGDPAP